jgi:hypothetical protein
MTAILIRLLTTSISIFTPTDMPNFGSRNGAAYAVAIKFGSLAGDKKPWRKLGSYDLFWCWV